MTKDKEMGVVYVLSNAMMPGIVKIGMTLRKDVNVRMNELYGTGVPMPFKCEYACSIENDKCKALESALHTAFHPYRVNPNREFFQIEPYQVVELLKFIDRDAEDLTEVVSEDIQNNLTEGDKLAVANEVKKQTKRPPLNFASMGICSGSELVYAKDRNIKCVVCADRKVRFNEEITSLTAVTKKLLNANHAVQPTSHWEFNGRNLQEIYDETFPFDD